MEMILGKDDAVRMREAASIIGDASREMGKRREAFELLHDLVENIDNANNVAKMGLWPAMLSFLTDDGNGEEGALRMDALRLVALAAKNNEEAQAHLVSSGVLDKLVSMVETSCGDDDEMDLSLVRRLVMALSALAPARGSPRWDAFMEQQSAVCLGGLLDRQPSLQDGLVFLVLNYSWSRGHLPACLQDGQRLHSLVVATHFEHCDDPECSLASLSHRNLNH